MKRVLHENGLSLFFLLMTILSLAGQSVAGHAEYNEMQITDGYPPISWITYVTSSSFAVDVAENWQSEYLQFFLYIVVTVWLVQRGSHESKAPGEEGTEEPTLEGPHPFVYRNSLGLVMGLFFLLSWLAQAVAGQAAYNEEQIAHLQDPLKKWGEYVFTPDFWNRTLQNWQSEFLAVLSMIALSIYLRQSGSPESKRVSASHSQTGG